MKFEKPEIEQLRKAYNELMMKRSMFGSGFSEPQLFCLFAIDSKKQSLTDSLICIIC